MIGMTAYVIFVWFVGSRSSSASSDIIGYPLGGKHIQPRHDVVGRLFGIYYR